MKRKSVSGVLTLNFIPKKKGGSWWAIGLSVMSGVGGSKQLVMTAQAIKERCFSLYKCQEF
ncbi:hypothetical protein F7220_02680 [Helicobacter pylori]|uniref:hypothetical protein n=1 Tax=Helicobacter pylori TaxID=210 RepID=UPI0012E740D7|nr:hypothetical protein [Helicobacter pylori]MUU51841.1 hypothetical protein [Helicobacter pylori]MUU61381.1 hypothetical protein [Helicobacter pylori]MUU96198.1 hypothetical protein [Helicobacter pylori]